MTVLVVHRTADFVFEWPVFAPDGTTPLDMSAASATGWVRDVYADEFLVEDASSWFDLSMLGVARLTIPGAINDAWSWERGVFSFYLTDLAAGTAPLDSGLILATYF